MTNKPVILIAQAHQCQEDAARKFCEAVQQCFKSGSGLPTFRLIAQHVIQSPQAPALEIAQRISPALHYGSAGITRLSKQKDKNKGAGYDYRIDDLNTVLPTQGWGSAGKNRLRSLNRLEPAKAAACPHGIPFYRKCGICNKKEFEEATGL